MNPTRAAACCAGLALGLLTAAADQARPAPVDFNRDVRPILSNNCFKCHGPDEKERKAELRLDTPDGAAEVVVAGKPDESELVRRVTSKEPREQMPPRKSGKTLTAAEIDTLTRW